MTDGQGSPEPEPIGRRSSHHPGGAASRPQDPKTEGPKPRARNSEDAMDPNACATCLSFLVVTLAAAAEPQTAQGTGHHAPELRGDDLDLLDLAARRLGIGADGTLYVLRGARAQGFYLPSPM